MFATDLHFSYPYIYTQYNIRKLYSNPGSILTLIIKPDNLTLAFISILSSLALIDKRRKKKKNPKYSTERWDYGQFSYKVQITACFFIVFRLKTFKSYVRIWAVQSSNLKGGKKKKDISLLWLSNLMFLILNRQQEGRYFHSSWDSMWNVSR